MVHDLALIAQMPRLRGPMTEDSDEEHGIAEHIDEWKVARQLTEHVKTVISTFTERTLMWKMLSGDDQSNFLAPIVLASSIIRALPVLDSDQDRLWSQGNIATSSLQ